MLIYFYALHYSLYVTFYLLPGVAGHYVHQFNDPGTYFYTTGVIGVNRDVELRGKIVVAAKEPIAAEVNVYVSGQKAERNSGSGELHFSFLNKRINVLVGGKVWS